MLKNLTKLKNILCKIVLLIGVVVLAIFSNTSFKTTKTVFALNKEDVSDEMLSSPNFYSSSNNHVSSNSNWKTLTPEDETNADSFKKGIVNVEKIESTIKSDLEDSSEKVVVNKLWENYGLFSSPGKVSNVNLDEDEQKGINNYLMINAYNFSGHMGYESDDFTLNKSSYYKIAVTLKTINDSKDVDIKDNEDDELTVETRKSDAKASIYLNGLSNEDAETSFELIETNNAWKTYYFYINTNSFTSEENLTMQLYLGSKEDSCQGAVFYSNIKIEEYSESEYTKEVTESLKEQSNIKVISLNNNYIYDFVNNASFENNMANWTTVGSANNGDIFATTIDTNSQGYLKGNSNYPAIPSNNNTSENNINALAIYSKPNENTSTYYGVESSEFTINQYGLYRISLWAYSDSKSSNGAYITIYDVDNSDKSIKQQISATSSSSTSSLNNNWTEYEFYIQGHSLRNCNLKIQFSIGTADSKDNTLNYAMFDDIRLQEITYTQYSSGQTSSNTLVLNSDADSNYLVSNYTFDTVQNENTTVTKALKPSSWVYSGSSEGVYSGVINTNTTMFANNSKNYGIINNLINPGKISPSSPVDTNNVLMLGTNKTNKQIAYTTEASVSMATNSYYKLSFDVFTQNLSESTKGANFIIKDENNAVLLNIENIQTNNQWKNYTYYINTALFPKNCKITVSLNNVDAYAYFDNIELTSIESDLFKELKENTNLNFVEFGNNILSDANSWSNTDNTDNATVGFINANDYDISVNNSKIAYILADTKDVKYHLISKESVSLSSDSYYKVSAYINTRDIVKLIADENEEYGATFYVNYNDEMHGFDCITTDSDEFIKYIIYIDAQASTNLKILFGLGTENNKVSGIAYFTNLEIVKFEDKEAMLADKEVNNNSVIKQVEVVAEETEEESDNEETIQIYTANWLALSSLTTSVAMILAILAFFIRKINFKKRKKKVSTNYDRRQTLDKRYDIKERIAYREELLENLNNELKNIKETTEEVVKEHNEKLEAIKNSTELSSEGLRKQLNDLYKKKLEISKEHNKIIAKDKLNAPKEEDIAYSEKIANIEKEEKLLTKKVKAIEKTYDKEKSKLDALISRSEKRQQEIKDEINNIKKEIKQINEELTNLNTSK